MPLAVSARSLLKVSVNEIDEANTLFGELMGDKVEPPRVHRGACADCERGGAIDASPPDAWMLK